MIDGFKDQGTFDGEIRIATRGTTSCDRCRVTPRRDRIFVAPHGETASLDQGAIVGAPIADRRAKDGGGFGHAVSSRLEWPWGITQQHHWDIAGYEGGVRRGLGLVEEGVVIKADIWDLVFTNPIPLWTGMTQSSSKAPYWSRTWKSFSTRKLSHKRRAG